MLEAVFDGLRTAAGVDTVADLGAVYRENLGHNDCSIAAGVEYWREAYYFRLAVTHSRGRSFRKTRVIKWPYSTHAACDIEGVLADLEAVENAKTAGTLIDRRGGLGRFFDNLTGRAYYGGYEFSSVIGHETPVEVSAEIAESGDLTLVTLTERRKGSGFTLAHVPHQAFAAVRRSAEYLRRGAPVPRA